MPDQRTVSFTESWLPEDAPLRAARGRGDELGATPVSPAAGATLRLLAAASGTRHAVEIGGGCGVSGIWLLRGMPADGVLTSIDMEAEHQRLARLALTEAGFAPARFRLIPGRALQVLPRLSDGAYDLVFVDAAKEEYPGYLDEALRLLRPGGVVVFDNALWHDRVADPAQQDPATAALRELLAAVRENEELTPALLPVGDGLLAAVRRR